MAINDRITKVYLVPSRNLLYSGFIEINYKAKTLEKMGNFIRKCVKKAKFH